MSKFAKLGDRNRKQQTFDKEKIFVERCGQKINCFDAIQAANVDTNIYDVMKKYHCVADDAIELMKSRSDEQGIYMDIAELQNQIQDIGDMQKIIQKAQTLFEQLPTEIKQKYGNNPIEFYQQQEKLFKDLNELKQKQNTKPTEQEKNNGGQVNETK